MNIRLATPSDKEAWDQFVTRHPDSTHCHLFRWKDVIENAYGHKGYYLMALVSSDLNNPMDPINSTNSMKSDSQVVGVLPLFHLKSFLFGKQLVSVPFLNCGGVLADDEQTQKTLISEAIELGQRLKVNKIELRHIHPLAWMDGRETETTANQPAFQTYTNKARMLLELPGSGEELFRSFKPRLKNKIRRPEKEGMKAMIGGQELLDSFYDVFCINMRDLGSPVHSKEFFRQICHQFNQNVKIGIVDHQGMPVAAGIICCLNDAVEMPWVSSLKKYNRIYTNMFLYWSFLEYSCENGYKHFDFGRSTIGGGTYKFKEQWGAEPTTLHWQFILLNPQRRETHDSEKLKFEKFIHYWQKLPVSFTKIVGPRIRRHIGL